MNLTILKTELSNAEYQGLSDVAALDLINSKVVPTIKKVDYSDVIGYLTYAEKIVGIVQATTTAAVEIKYLASELNSFDLSSPLTSASVNRLLDALITDGLITTTDKQKIINMATGDPISKAQELGLGIVRLGDIETARV